MNMLLIRGLSILRP